VSATSGDRTEKPTERRRRDARKKGQLARSREVERAAQLVAVLVVLAWAGPALLHRTLRVVRAGIEASGQWAHRTIDPGAAATIASSSVAQVGMLVGPIALAAAVSTVLAATLQGGWNVASQALTPDWSRLTPAHGLRRLSPGRAGLDLIKMAAMAAVLAWIAGRVVGGALLGAPALARTAPEAAAPIVWEYASRLLQHAAVALCALAGLDYLLQRWRLGQSLRMTRQELRDDLRLTEGHPEIKARLRRLQRDLLRRRMLAAVPKATVVVTNPTHFAVALRYERSRMTAPQVVAKGRNLIAQRIREVARAHGVPIVENVPLAQALYRGAEVGDTIPGDLFGAVAEVLAYLIRLKQIAI
jgi:flagellar biosynthetic protein FlhB